MNKFLIVAIACIIAAISFSIWDKGQRGAQPENTSLDLRTLAKHARSAVVSIEVFDNDGNSIGRGSGFFVSNDGLLVTNYHVIKNASNAIAKTASGDQLSLKGAVYFDRDNDLAVLLPEGKKFPFLPLGNSSKIEVGDHVAVIGNPLGLEGSLSEGIISGKRDLTSARPALPTPVESDNYPPPRNFVMQLDKLDWLQITAPISPGSSGSPVFDTTGNVIGIATMLLREGQSLNFAVPAEVVIAMLETRKQQPRKQRPLVKFEGLRSEDDAINNSFELAFNKASEWTKAEEAWKKGIDAEMSGMQGRKTEPPDWGNVLELAKIVVEKYPDRYRGWELLGRVYVKINLLGDAISAYQQAIALPKHQSNLVPEIWGELGATYEKMHQTTQARNAFSQAVVLQKKVVAVRSQPDWWPLHRTAEQLSQARKDRADSKASALMELGDYYAGAGDSERAKKSYLQAITESPANYTTGLALVGLAGVCIKGNDVAVAFTTVYDGMVLAGSQNPEADAWAHLSYAYSNAGKNEAADRCFNKAMSLGWMRR